MKSGKLINTGMMVCQFKMRRNPLGELQWKLFKTMS